MSSPEYEGFGMTDNDLLDAMDPIGRRRKQTKEQSVYGMWADDDSDDERPGLGSGGKQRKDYAKPIGFISGGLKKSAQDKADQEDKEAVEEESFSARRGFGSGGRAGASREPAGVKRVGATATFGEWERHTKGIGKKLLAKMGWERGRGLGKNQQGIAAPVDAYVRKGKGALGFYGTERVEPVDAAAKAALTRKVGAAATAEATGPKLGQWKKAPGEKKRVNYVVRTVADLVADGAHRDPAREVGSSTTTAAAAGIKVIDLTGKEKRIYTSYSAISKHHHRPESEGMRLEGDEPDAGVDTTKPFYFAVPELTHNLNLLVRSAEDDIIANLRRRDRASDQVVCLEHERVRLEEVISDEERTMEQMQGVMSVVEKLEGAANLDDAAQLILELRDEFPDEYKLYGLSRLASGVLEPLFRKKLENWDPLDSSNEGLEAVAKMQNLLLNDDSGLGSSEVYQTLLWEAWMPPVRRAIIGRWNPRDPETLIATLERWKPFLTPWIWVNVQDQLLIPRLLTEAENWNPVTDTLPIHTWIHPWLGLLGEKLQPVYLPIKQKIGSALNNWHPSDPSARMMLTAWIDVWSEGAMRAFVLQYIAPKLARSLQQDLVVNPQSQNLDPWRWVFDWVGSESSDYRFLSHPVLVGLLDHNFFPKWLHTLAAWLDSSSCDYGEVSKWYTGWKSMFPALLLDDPTIRDHFSRALAMMSGAMSGRRASDLLHQPTVAQPPPPPPAPVQPSVRPQGYQGPAPAAPATFKELVELRAHRTGLMFVPLASRSREGKQVYQLGQLQIYIDRNVVFMLSPMDSEWTPVSIDHLFELATAS